MNAGRALVGTVLVAVGSVFLLDAAGALEAGAVLADWWPLAVVMLGVYQVAAARRVGVASGVLIAAGLLLLTATTGVFGSVRWSLLWPVVLIAAGIGLLLGWGKRRMGAVDEPEVAGIAVLGSTRVATRSAEFRRASVTAVLGSVTLDLTRATPVPGGASVSAAVVLGGMDVVVPAGWAVSIRGIPLFGAWDDTTTAVTPGPDTPRLDIQALVVLGGLEVKHARRWS